MDKTTVYLIILFIVLIVGILIAYWWTHHKGKKKEQDRFPIYVGIKFTLEEVIFSDRGKVSTFKRNDKPDLRHVEDFLTKQYQLWLSDYTNYDQHKTSIQVGQGWAARLNLDDRYTMHLKVEFETDCKSK